MSLTPVPRRDITGGDVAAAMDYLQMTNPKPEIPLATTVVGYLIVAVAEKLRELERRTNPERNA